MTASPLFPAIIYLGVAPHPAADGHEVLEAFDFFDHERAGRHVLTVGKRQCVRLAYTTTCRARLHERHPVFVAATCVNW